MAFLSGPYLFISVLYLGSKEGSRPHFCTAAPPTINFPPISLYPACRPGLSLTERVGRHDKRISQYPPGPVTSLSETSLRLGLAVSSSNCCHQASHIFSQPFLLQDLVIALPRGQGREPKRYPNPPSCSSASSISATGVYRRQQNWSPAQHRIPVPGGDPHPNRASLRHDDPNFHRSHGSHCYSC